MSEKDDWDGLRQHPGWLRLKADAEKYWNDQLAAHVARAADERDDVVALQKLRQVVAAQRAVQVLLRWPEERLRVVDGATAQRGPLEPLMQRGGYASTR